MEGFSLLNYWRPSEGSGGNTTIVQPCASTKTIFASTAAVSPDSSDGEDGPYFDLEFTLPEDESDAEEELSVKTDETYQRSQKTANGNETETGNGGEEFSESGTEDEEEEVEDVKITLFPTEQLIFNGNLVSVEPTSNILNDSEENSRFPVFLLKSATKFRVLLLKLKKSKSVSRKGEKIECNGHENSSPQQVQVKQSTLSGKFLTVMCKAEEVRMPLVSLFTRDNSSKSKHYAKCTKKNQQDFDSNSTAVSGERKLTKEVVHKYIKMVKPLSDRVSKRYVEKLKFSGQWNFTSGASKRGGGVSLPEKGTETEKAASSAGSVKTQPKQASINNNLQAGLKVVRKHLGKSRSASAIATLPPLPEKMASSRRDDSLLQIHDGIQGAILHCKKSFNATRDVESSVLSRSASDPSYEKSVIMPKDSSSSSSPSPSSSSFSGEETEENLNLS
ncbi:putative membrane-associated kinase regulator 2 [Dorcoceras hygrometricum]|uniref:Putative membrane-associated kinase regulator 2 n=1 Tax=Dorcoceras hygrometricum TaxID=472368 RepID=A0A2Z7CDH8_9LAMI|nr:putative membrane-associated kinase regulator 2 [Dorcoceras hygrometricum]